MSEFTITSAQYCEGVNPDGTVFDTQHTIKATIDGVELNVPIDTNNRHYAAIKAKHDDADDSFTIQDAD